MPGYYLAYTAIFMSVLNFALTFMNQLNNDNHDKYHMYDSLPGLIMVGFRVLVVVLLIAGVCATR